MHPVRLAHGRSATPMTHPACTQCGRPVDGESQRYCPQCGQPTPPPRIDWHFLGHELEHSILHMDRGLLFTLRELMLRPGRLLRDYLAGRRLGHAKPLLLIMVMAAAVTLGMRAVQWLHPDANATLMGSAPAPGADEGMAASAAMAGWMQRNYALLTLLLLPLQAGCFRLLFGRGYGLNYPEWLVVVALLTVQAFVLQCVALAVGLAWPSAFHPTYLLMILLAVVYGCASLPGLFPARPAWRVLLRALAAFVLFMVASILSTTVAGVVIVQLQRTA